MKFNVVYTIDRAYQVPFCCSLTSLLSHNKGLIDRVFVVQNVQSASSEEFKKTSSFVNEAYGLNINSIEIDDSQFNELRADRHVSHATYYRLCLADFLPNDVQSILLLDPDTIITKELSLFSELDFLENPELMCYAVDHGYGSIDRLKSLCPTLESYFNAGVLFLNIQLMRNENISPTLIRYGIDNKDGLLFWDQDILNILFNKRWKKLPPSYNAFDIKKKLVQTPEIIHYTGNRKPWNIICDHVYRELYWQVLSRTPFYNFKSIIREKFGGLITLFLVPIITVIRGN
ncbi:glycosyltransferase family 8 protein [Reichenbachiella sp. MALMAid0571]|uniref:glycosyltransferase family 8 protein n=1 Tax=Reichenbachiella sp. MALMAid0571 TaxID=3143939 RepID=UPI0032E038B3